MSQEAKTKSVSGRLPYQLRNILFHRLGADPSEGLAHIEYVFQIAEANFDVQLLEEILSVLIDDNLKDRVLGLWYQYYVARKTVLEMRLEEAETRLSTIDLPPEEQLLSNHINLLRARIAWIRNDIRQSLRLLERVEKNITPARSTGGQLLLIEVLYLKAELVLRMARNGGGLTLSSATTIPGSIYNYLRSFSRLISPGLWVVLIRYPLAWRAVLLSADFNNWPILSLYLRALSMLRRARRIRKRISSGDFSYFQLDSQTSIIREIDLIRANIFLELRAYGKAKREFEKLSQLDLDEDSYELSAIKLGLGRVLLGRDIPAEAYAILQEVGEHFRRSPDLAPNAAHVDLFLGDAKARQEPPDIKAAIQHWTSALKVFDERNDLSGKELVLQRAYGLAEPNGSENAQQLIKQVQPKLFRVRVPDKNYDRLQRASSALPVILFPILAIIITGYMLTASRASAETLARFLLSSQGLVTIAGIVIIIPLIFSAFFSSVALALTFLQPLTYLDVFVLSDQGILKRFGTSSIAGNQADLDLQEVETVVSVNRGPWFTPDPIYSGTYLLKSDAPNFTIPGITNAYNGLISELKHFIPDEKIQEYRLQWYGGLPNAFVFAGGMALVLAVMTSSIPGLSVPQHGWLAIIVTLLVYVFAFGSNWAHVQHAVQVQSRIARSKRRYRNIVVGLGIVSLVGVGVLLREVSFLAAAFFCFVGGNLLIQHIRATEQAKSGRLDAQSRLKIAAIGVVTLAAVVFTLVPILLHLQAFTYTGALTVDPNNPIPEAEYTQYFERVEQLGRWMTRIDPGYAWGYGFVGYAQYSEDQFEEAIDSFTESVEHDWSIPNGDHIYCRAFAYARLGDEDKAAADCERAASNARFTGNEDAACAQLFPEDISTCPNEE